MASLLYLLNPLTLLTCVGSTTSPIKNLMVILCLYGACTGVAPLAAFGWVIATHLSLYPAILLIPVMALILLQKSFSNMCLLGPIHIVKLNRLKKVMCKFVNSHGEQLYTFWSGQHFGGYMYCFCAASLLHVMSWVGYVSVEYPFYLYYLSNALTFDPGLWICRTYGFILTVSDLSPNAGVLCPLCIKKYFFAEVFNFFRVFFFMVFHASILFMMLPLAVRLYYRPCFLAFVYITIFSMLKSYPSVGDSSLYLGLIGLFANELAEILLICQVESCLMQTILIVESVSTMLNHDRKLKKQLQA
ncbi:Phosphatidylinositol glycan anchor biosynthesis class U protein [Nymphaea thermarum]|nr:Phosphatidylinositol glycan anchor biosynthesis class U protein [Nymphaea thermarum]